MIERALTLWSNPGDVVFTPFLGIGSEIYGALHAKRRGVGTELKESYWKQACGYLAEAEAGAVTLLDYALGGGQSPRWRSLAEAEVSRGGLKRAEEG